MTFWSLGSDISLFIMIFLVVLHLGETQVGNLVQESLQQFPGWFCRAIVRFSALHNNTLHTIQAFLRALQETLQYMKWRGELCFQTATDAKEAQFQESNMIFADDGMYLDTSFSSRHTNSQSKLCKG